MNGFREGLAAGLQVLAKEGAVIGKEMFKTTGKSTVKIPPCAAGTAFRPVILSHTVHTQAASA